MTPYITTDLVVVRLDEKALSRGKVKLAAGASSEPCDDCGVDLIPNARLKSSSVVACRCDAEFPIRNQRNR
jgi:hypothetical protein